LTLARCIRAVADLQGTADAASERVSQCLFGERVDVLGRSGDWCRVRNRRDGYVGHVPTDALDHAPGDLGILDGPDDGPDDGPEGTGGPGDGRDDTRIRIVGVRATLLFARPDLKSPLRLRVPFGAELTLSEGVGNRADTRPGDDAGAEFVRVTGLARRHGTRDAFARFDHLLAPGTTLAGSPVDVARRLYDGAPYLWGGRTPDGADCSGLVQGTAFAVGVVLPRDSGEQERALERIVPHDERAASDLVFWPGHVGLLIDPDTLYHATAHTLATAVEPLDDVVRRAGRPSSIRRLPDVSRRRGGA